MALQCAQFSIIIIISFSGMIMGRQRIGPYFPRQQLAFDDTLSDEDYFYNDIKMPENDQMFLANWPWLRELVPPAADTSLNPNSDDEKLKLKQYLSKDQTDSKLQNQQLQLTDDDFIEKNSLYSFGEALPTPLPYTSGNRRKNSFKVANEKKNNHYMSLCHFKICNMGRKRNTRFLHL